MGRGRRRGSMGLRPCWGRPERWVARGGLDGCRLGLPSIKARAGRCRYAGPFPHCAAPMKTAPHPLWLVGFRPFFVLACAAGAALPMLWALVFADTLTLPAGRLSPLQWHAHEMLFGFGWAVLGGFLLTASKNWVQIRGYHGAALKALVAAWCVERIGISFGGTWPAALFWASAFAFLGAIVAMLVATLVRHRARDSFRDNLFFIVALPLFLVAKALVLDADHFHAGVSMTLGLYRLAFLVMLERTLTTFMKNGCGVDLPRDPWLDGPIKGLALVLVGLPWLPAGLAVALLLVEAVLLTARFFRWRPDRAFRRLELAVMYVGYLALIAQLLAEAWSRIGAPGWVGSVPVHLLTVGAMGPIIPAMLVRISKGHTGRKVSFDAFDKAVLWVMLAALGLRIGLPQLAPGLYGLWVDLAAAAWGLGFGALGLRILPRVLAPRVDGKVH